MRALAIAPLFVASVGCQRVERLDADPSVSWLAVLQLDEEGAIERASGLLPIGDELPRQSDEGRALVLGFASDRIEELRPSVDQLAEPLRFASECDPVLVPVWAAERTGGEYRASSAASAPPVTLSWLGAKCPVDRVCLLGRCVDAIVEIDAGRNFACGRWASGRISCWGGNGDGSLGRPEGELSISTEAAFVPELEGAEELSCGDGQVCVRREGRVLCWGPDHQGEQLGMPAAVRGVPRPIMGISEAIGVSAGDAHACVLLDGGRVECWGQNDRGQLGDGTLVSRALPVEAIDVAGAVRIGTGAEHSCALMGDGRVLCWGGNERGQLGPGQEPIVEAIARGARSLGVARYYGCAVLDAGEVSCWGDNVLGQLGAGTPKLSGPAVALELGEETACALLGGGTIECWGGSRHGEIGSLDPFPFYVDIPRAPPAPGSSIDLAVGGNFACSLERDRSVWCWGGGGDGQLGNGRSGHAERRQIALEGDVQKIAAGDEMTCALLAGGSVLCWGHNEYGQLGRGTKSVIEGPGSVLLPGPAIDVAAGVAHACAIIEGGDVYCWGDNYRFAATPLEVTEVQVPERIAGGAVDLALGDFHSCAVLVTGEVSCWGDNMDGAVGHGGGGAQAPALVPGVANAISGDAGLDQTCVVRGDGTVSCWGRPSFEEELTGVDELAVGRRHACARSGGRVLCWGYNDHGQLGDGTFTPRERPMPVLGIDTAQALVGGTSHVCAVIAGGELHCWGDNLFAQLNDGARPADRATPAPVPRLTGVRIGDGFRQVCVHTETGRVECWGWNEWGQVSFETAPLQIVPSRVLGLEPF